MVFISYSSKDADAANAVRMVLQQNGIDCWMAPESIPMGGDYSNDIPDAIEKCDIFLLILSANSQNSNWVPKELDIAISNRKPVVPFQIDNEGIVKSFNFRLSNIQRIEAFHNLEKAYSNLISHIKLELGNTRSDLIAVDLPDFYSYYQMLGINDVSQLSIDKLRTKNDITRSIAVPIGINRNGDIVHLDLHQRGDGPNGLIAGPPGSGKSEFLSTLCLSLSLFFSPEEIKLHIMDRWLPDKFKELPHLGKCLTEYSIDAVDAFIDEIDSEIQRRFSILEKNSVPNVYQYLKNRKVSNPLMDAMPHLLIILDDLASFKVCFPDAFKKIRQWGSRINTSLLGIHIIITTQNPDSTIDAALWRMFDFKICSSSLKKIDSENVSKRPGRLYFQSRAKSKIQIIQLAYCGKCIDDKESLGFNGFFESKYEKNEIVELIKRFELD